MTVIAFDSSEFASKRQPCLHWSRLFQEDALTGVANEDHIGTDEKSCMFSPSHACDKLDCQPQDRDETDNEQAELECQTIRSRALDVEEGQIMNSESRQAAIIHRRAILARLEVERHDNEIKNEGKSEEELSDLETDRQSEVDTQMLASLSLFSHLLTCYPTTLLTPHFSFV